MDTRESRKSAGLMQVLMLLKTTSLKHDDRVRKECEALIRQGAEPELLVLESENSSSGGIAWGKVRYRSISLRSRCFPRGKMLWLKSFELYVIFVRKILFEKRQVVWLHNLELVGLVPVLAILKKFGRVRLIVWDQHELPSDTSLRSWPLRRLLRVVNHLVDVVVVANQARATLLRRLRLVRGRYLVVENLADKKFATRERALLPGELVSWLSGKSYYLAQGGAAPNRHFLNLVKAVMRANKRLVVVGSKPAKELAQLYQEFSESLNRSVYFTGWVDQDEMPRYIDHARASVVFYSCGTRNGRYCAPNRMYQALARGVPVIVGRNATMRSLVLRHAYGVALVSDGDNIDDAVSAIHALEAEHARYLASATVMREAMLFESQDDVFRELLEMVPI